jgi:tRNA nucleotidyltransferase (CCA-adding enzyme)
MLGFLESLIEDIKAAGGKTYKVGGPVRDELLGIEQPEDLDLIVCGVPFTDLKKLLKKHGDINLVGQTFGVIKFRPSGEDYTIDISLPRKELSTGSGHRDFDVDFDHTLPIEEDLKRRDFTINAMAVDCVTDKLIDPYGGEKDLRERILRVVSDASFVDDPLRMLRGVQFAGRFGLTVEPDTLKAMMEHAELINTVSPERIADELNKLLEKAEKPSTGFHLMHQTGLLQQFLPEFSHTIGVDQPGGYHRWDVFEHTLKVVDAAPQRLIVRLAALFHDLGKPDTKELTESGASFYGHDKLSRSIAENILKRFRYPNNVIKKVGKLIERHMFSEGAGDKGIRKLINKVGLDLIFDLIDLRRADTIGQGMGQTTESIDEFERKVREEIDKRSAFGIKDLAIDGEDLKKHFNLPEGKLIGDILSYLLDRVLDEPGLNNSKELLTLSADFLAKRRLDI